MKSRLKRDRKTQRKKPKKEECLKSNVPSKKIIFLPCWVSGQSHIPKYMPIVLSKIKRLFFDKEQSFRSPFLKSNDFPSVSKFPSLLNFPHVLLLIPKTPALRPCFFFLCWNLKRVTISQRKSVKTLTDRKGLFKTVFRSEILKGTLLLPMLIGGEHEFFRAAKTPCDFKVTPHFPR
jgi:hypothetical protein